jgi:hypothetical protein
MEISEADFGNWNIQCLPEVQENTYICFQPERSQLRLLRDKLFVE